MAKTTETLNHPVRIYFDDGECYHERAAIVFTLGAPAYVRAEHPNAIYPWERVQSIIRIADDDENGMRKTAAPKTERDPLKNKGVRPGSMADTYLDNERQALIADNERLRETIDHLKEEVGRHANGRSRLAKEITAHFNSVAAAAGFTGDDNLSIDDLVSHIANLRADLASVTEERDLLKKSLAIRDGRGKNMVNLIAALTKALDLKVAPDPSDETQLGHLVSQVADLFRNRAETRRLRDEALLDLESVTEQRAELRRQLEDLRAELRRPVLQEPKHEREPADADAAQATRDSIRTTCLSAGAKDCTVYLGPGKDDITIVVEMRSKYTLSEITEALIRVHGLAPSQYKLREVKS